MILCSFFNAEFEFCICFWIRSLWRERFQFISQLSIFSLQTDRWKRVYRTPFLFLFSPEVLNMELDEQAHCLKATSTAVGRCNFCYKIARSNRKSRTKCSQCHKFVYAEHQYKKIVCSVYYSKINYVYLFCFSYLFSILQRKK